MKKYSSVSAQQRAAFVLVAVSFYSFSIAFAQGNFQKAFGIEGFEKGSALKQLPDGGFIIGGETQSYGLQETDMLLMRTDAGGNLQWSKTYGGPEREVINDVVLMNDNGFLFLAERYQPDKKEGEFLTLGKTDGSGKLLWKKIIDESGNETEGFSMNATSDGNYIITGITRKLNIVSTAFFNVTDRNPKLYLLKVDGNGNKIWSRCLLVSDAKISTTGNSVITAKDGSYIITGNISRSEISDAGKSADDAGNSDSRNMLLLKVNTDGSLAWANEYGANRVTAGFRVIEKQDGGFVVVGIATPDNTNNVDYFMMSIAADGALQWSKTFGGAKFDAVSDVSQTTDGGFLVSGSTNSFGAGASDVLLFKTDAKGNVLWAKTYGSESGEYGAQLSLTANGIALTGQVSMGKESYDVLLLKTDASGNAGCLGANAAVVGKNFSVTAKKITNASTTGIEPVNNPNYKKPDANNIGQQGREVRAKNICQ
ncbi:MAG: hypothetical protein SH857_00955 [Chitinophagales bacterium]|nr:hypothetical protein [Chitinophagales bacterium]